MARLSHERLALYSTLLASKGVTAPCAAPLPRRAVPERAPLSAAQERLFFLELYEPLTALYNDALMVVIEGPLERPRLGQALAGVVARHEILRTTFVLAGDGPEQRVHGPEHAPRLAELDFSQASDPEAAARAFAREDAALPFDLEQRPPWRLTLARLAERRWALVLGMHHILSDGASMGCFFDELTQLYCGSAPAPLAVQFGDYATFERAAHDARQLERSRSFWQRNLAGLATWSWPMARGSASGRGAQIPVRLAADELAHLARFARAEQATVNQVLLAAWCALLGHATGTGQVCTGLASSLRKRRELEGLIGFFVQSLPLRVDVDGAPDFRTLLRRTREAAFAAQEHDTLPLDQILRAAALERPPFRTFFSHMRDALRPPAFPGTRARIEFVDPGTARFDLALVLHESSAGLHGFLEYDLGVFEPAAAERLAGDYAGCLRDLPARAGRPLGELAGPHGGTRRHSTAPRRATGS